MELALETDRLRLVAFDDSHLDAFAAMNADAEVMEYFPAVLTPDESASLLQRLIEHREKHGFAPFALHQKSDNAFIGFTGLMVADFDAQFTPAVEIGWRFTRACWGKGLGPEAARACLRFGFADLRLDEIVSFTAKQNRRSISVMEKLQMHHTADDDFLHPNLAEDDPLRPHVLYRIRRDQWTASLL